jgi:hypothetical protein
MSILLIVFSSAFILKSISLSRMIKDGDGIGLYFLGFEINDKILFEQIPKYSWSFLIIGLVLIFVSVVLFYNTLNYKDQSL